MQSNPLEKYRNVNIHEIVVENKESITVSYMLEQSVMNASPILLIGPTGTGKTVYTMKYLKQLPHEK